jgi:hypothetical protein
MSLFSDFKDSVKNTELEWVADQDEQLANEADEELRAKQEKEWQEFLSNLDDED